MKIGASTLAGLHDTLEDCLEFIEGLGIEFAELVHQFPSEFIEIELLESFNLKSIEQIKSSIDLASEIDAETVVVHPGFMPFLARPFEDKVYETANKSILELGNYAKDLGVNAAIENMPTFEGMIYKDLKKLDQFLTENEMSMTLDIGHANHVGYSADEMYFDSIKHIHAHDNFGDDDSHLALGEGSIDLKHIIKKFESKNYDGIYIIEVNDNDSIKKSFEYMKENF